MVKGSSAGFEGLLAGTGPFEVTWHKDAKELKPSAKHGFSQVNGSVGLEVHKCDTVDVGEYQCTVTNEVGSCACKTTLNLKGWSPQIHMEILRGNEQLLNVSPVFSRRTTNIYQED